RVGGEVDDGVERACLGEERWHRVGGERRLERSNAVRDVFALSDRTADGGATGEEKLGEIGADLTGDAGHQHLHHRASFFIASRSASTMSLTRSAKRTGGSQPRTRFAFEASPMRTSTSIGRK